MECHKLTDGDNGIDCNRVDELCTKHEEADTLMLLHAGHASPNGHDCIVIKSPDTGCPYVHLVTAYDLRTHWNHQTD